jgi:hypothetical protein
MVGAETRRVVAAVQDVERPLGRVCGTGSGSSRGRRGDALNALAGILPRDNIGKAFAVGDSIDVRRSDVPDQEQGEREVNVHLRVWLVMHPGSIEKPTRDVPLSH